MICFQTPSFGCSLEDGRQLASKPAHHKQRVARPSHRIDTQPEVRLRVGAFDVGVLVFSAAVIFLASVHGKCLLCRFYEEKQFVVNFGTWTMNQDAL